MTREGLDERVEERAVGVLDAQRLQLRGRVRQRGRQQRAQHVQSVQHVALQRKRRSGEKGPQRGLRGLETRRVPDAQLLRETPTPCRTA